MPGDALGALGWSLVIIVLLVIGFVAVFFLRKWVHEDDAPTKQETFTLGDLRHHLKQGTLTQEEYDRLRQHIVVAAKKDTRDPLEGRRPKPPQKPNPDAQ